MGKKQITRKEFFSRSLAGIAGLGMLKQGIGADPFPKPLLRQVGNTGIMTSPLCFGAPRTNDEALIRYALAKGINFVDTGRSYGNGRNEELVGKAVRGERDKYVIQTKIKLEKEELPSSGKGKKGAGEIRDVLSSKLEASLKALGTTHLDILLIHDAADENLLFHPETLKFFKEMKDSGVIRAAGFSTHNDTMVLHERNNRERFFDLIMVPFNHSGSYIHSQTGRHSQWDQEKLIALLTEAGEKGIGVVAMKTCSAGKYSPSPDIEASFPEAVHWVLQHKFISSAAIAMANFEEVDQHTMLLLNDRS